MLVLLKDGFKRYGIEINTCDLINILDYKKTDSGSQKLLVEGIYIWIN
jgi:hypothetical protein